MIDEHFAASAGLDPASGLGTPNGLKLLAALQAGGTTQPPTNGGNPPPPPTNPPAPTAPPLTLDAARQLIRSTAQAEINNLPRGRYRNFEAAIIGAVAQDLDGAFVKQFS